MNERGFENLVVWRGSRDLARTIRSITERAVFARDRKLQQQMRSSASSIMSNIAEGYERGNRAEFHHALVVAKGSCGELRSQLIEAHDARYISSVEFEELRRTVTKISGQLERLRQAVDGQRNNLVDRRRRHGGPK